MILLMEDSAGIFVVLYCHKRSIERFTYIIIVLYFLSISSIFQKFYLFFENYLHLQQKNHCFQRFRDIVLLPTVVMRFHSLISSISVRTFHCNCTNPHPLRQSFGQTGFTDRWNFYNIPIPFCRQTPRQYSSSYIPGLLP